MKTITDIDRAKLELLVSEVGLSVVLGAIANICAGKRECIREALGPDTACAAHWHKMKPVVASAAHVAQRRGL